MQASGRPLGLPSGAGACDLLLSWHGACSDPASRYRAAAARGAGCRTQRQHPPAHLVVRFITLCHVVTLEGDWPRGQVRGRLAGRRRDSQPVGLPLGVERKSGIGEQLDAPRPVASSDRKGPFRPGSTWSVNLGHLPFSAPLLQPARSGSGFSCRELSGAAAGRGLLCRRRDLS